MSITFYTATTTIANGTIFSTSTVLGIDTWVWNTATTRWWSTQEPSQQYAMNPGLIEDQVTTATTYFSFPSGTTAQRPANPQVGSMRFNTDLAQMEYYNNAGAWIQIISPAS
jgi:hypothetical protein